MSSAVQIHVRNTLVYVSKRFQRLIGPQEHLFWFLNTNFREDLYFAAQLSSEHKTSVGGGVSVTSRLYLLPMVPAVIPETCYYIHYFYNFFKPLFTFLESSNYFSLNQKVSSTIYIANNTKERKQNWDEYFSRVLIIQQKYVHDETANADRQKVNTWATEQVWACTWQHAVLLSSRSEGVCGQRDIQITDSLGSDQPKCMSRWKIVLFSKNVCVIWRPNSLIWFSYDDDNVCS